VSDANDLSESVSRFLDSWLIERRVDDAMRHVSDHPVLGSCSLPPTAVVSSRPSGKEASKVLERILGLALEATPRRSRLEDLIVPLRSFAESTPLAKDTPFDLFRPNNPTNSRLICKFDEDQEFRRVLADPGVVYVSFRIPQSDVRDFDWVVAWQKEAGKWKVISLAMVED